MLAPSPPRLAALALAALVGGPGSALAVPTNGTANSSSYASAAVQPASSYGSAAASAYSHPLVSSSATAVASSAVAAPVGSSGIPTVSVSYLTQTVTVTVTAPSEPSATSGGPDEYPAPEVRGEGQWEEPVRRAKALLADWTLEQLVNITTGVGWMYGPCVGNIAAQPDLDFPGLCLQDAPSGVRFADLVSVFPAGINAGSTFDRKLMRARGLAMGQEFAGKGVNIALAPAMGIARNADGGRNFESFGADPYLVGEGAYETVKGIQAAGVQANAKHYIANEQEHNRTTSSSNLDDRTLHEIYLHPFLRAVQADVASFMCSYNLINNTYACENSKLQNDILKHELGFQGTILSDWQATMSGVNSALGGLDMTMPGDIVFNSGDSYFGANLTLAVNNGSVPLSRVKDMATRIVASWYLLDQDQGFLAPNFDSWDPLGKGEHVDVRAEHAKIIREVGAASTVLLKNSKGTLPLSDDLRSIAVIGNDAGPSLKGANGYADRGGLDGVLGMGWGSGTADYTYLVSPLEALQAHASKTGQVVSWTLDNYDLATVNATAKNRDIALVFIAADSGEGYINVDGNEGDRNNLTAWMNGDEIVLAAAANNDNVVVIIHSVGPIIVEPWIDHPNVTAVVYAGLPGQEAGNALLDVLSGGYNPSGRLPFTISKDAADYPTSISFYPPGDEPVQVDYTEALLIDYRHLQAQGIEPRFGFGFGLSYSEFSFSNLSVAELPWEKRHLADQHVYRRTWNESTAPATNGSASVGDVGSSVAEWLHAPRVLVAFDVTNESGFVGSEVPQLYLQFPDGAGEPPKVLRGFERVKLEGGESTRVEIALSTYDLSIWDVVSQTWTRPEGEFVAFVGKHAFDNDSLTATF